MKLFIPIAINIYFKPPSPSQPTKNYHNALFNMTIIDLWMSPLASTCTTNTGWVSHFIPVNLTRHWMDGQPTGSLLLSGEHPQNQMIFPPFFVFLRNVALQLQLIKFNTVVQLYFCV